MTKVLILDHSKSMRKTLGERLAYEGFAIEATDNVKEASEMCRQIAFDVVLIPTTAAMPRRSEFPSSYWPGASDNQIQRAVAAFRDGAMDYMQIPTDINRLYDTLRRYADEAAPQGEPPLQRIGSAGNGRARGARARRPSSPSSVRRTPSAMCATSSNGSPPSTPARSSPAKTAPARSWSHAGSMPKAADRQARSSKSTAQPSPPN